MKLLQFTFAVDLEHDLVAVGVVPAPRVGALELHFSAFPRHKFFLLQHNVGFLLKLRNLVSPEGPAPTRIAAE